MAIADWNKNQKLGEGGQGTTWKVSHRETGQVAVLKELHNASFGGSGQAKARMAQEVAALAAVNALGGAAPKVLDSTISEDLPDAAPSFVMEFVNGGTLEEVMRAPGKMSTSDAIAMTRELARTLEIAHRQGLVHRDIKPQNIILQGGEPKAPFLVDFGLSRPVHESSITMDGEQVGNRFLRLPEGQVHGNDHGDPRSDVTLLAGILLYALNGGIEPRVLVDQAGALPHRRLATRPSGPLNAAEKQGLDALFDRAFAQRIEHRFGSVLEFDARLKMVDNGGLTPEEDPRPWDEIAAEAARAITAGRPDLREQAAREVATRQAEGVRDRVHQAFGSAHGSDFRYHSDTRMGGGVALPGIPLIQHLSIRVEHLQSKTTYAATYGFFAPDNREIQVMKQAHLWNDQKAPWVGPILCFVEGTAEAVQVLLEDAKREVKKGIVQIGRAASKQEQTQS